MTENWKDIISGVYVSPGSAETLVRTGGITNHLLTAILSATSLPKIIKNRLLCFEVIVCYISVVFETQCSFRVAHGQMDVLKLSGRTVGRIYNSDNICHNFAHYIFVSFFLHNSMSGMSTSVLVDDDENKYTVFQKSSHLANFCQRD